MEALISVVIPVYNVEQYLDTCVRSVVSQTYRNLEIILVDDGSTDACASMCDAWAREDARIRVIHKENAGLGMARNTGIEQATGQYICFFDSDDYVHPQILEKACREAEDKKADLVIFGLSQVDNSGKVRREGNIQAKQTVFYGDEVRTKLLPDLINSSEETVTVKGLSMSVCVCLFSMELIRRACWKLVSERDIISEDSYSLLGLYRHVECAAVLAENGYYYRQNPVSLTQRIRTDRFEKTKAFYVKAIELCEKLGYTEAVTDRLARLYLAFLLGILKQIAVADQRANEKIKSCRQVITDETVQEILHRLTLDCYSGKIRLMFYAMRFKWSMVVYLMALVQARYMA